MCFFFFFFSSRRRHTRCSRDWSSDVCSSDLPSCPAGRAMPISLATPGPGRSAVPPRARARVTAYARRVLRREGVTRPDVTIVLGDDALLRSLYARFKGKDRATDVLSFTLDDETGPHGGRALTGEIYVSRQRLFAQAKRYRHTPGRELMRLVTH